MASVTFLSTVGGDDSTVTDDTNATTGLDGYGYATRLVPAFSQIVNVAAYTVTQAEAAAASAASALGAPGTNANSTTSVAIATGSKSFTIETGKLYSIGQTLVAASKANPANSMTGIVTAHNSGTGAITLSVSNISGSGTFADWTFSMAAVVSSTLPSQTGNANKFLQTDGTNASWQVALRPAQNLSDVSSVATARTNLGLGALALLASVNNTNWSGTALAVANGGTGATSTGAARTALGAAASGANTDITSLGGLTTALSVAQGGTGATTAGAARTALGLGTMATQAASAVAITGGTISGITDLAVADGGTGSGTAAGARSNLGAAASGNNSDITQLSGLTTPLAASRGGTGFSAANLTSYAGRAVSINAAGNAVEAIGYPIAGMAYCTMSGTTLTVVWQSGEVFSIVRASTGLFTITKVTTETNASDWGIVAFPFATASGQITGQEIIASRTTNTASLNMRDNSGTNTDNGFFLLLFEKPAT